MKELFRSDKKLNPTIRCILFFLLLSAFMLSGISSSFAAEQIPVKRVHVMYGRNPNFPAHQLFTEGLKDVFGQSSDKFQIEYSFEYLDLGLGRADEEYRAALAGFLKRKYSLKPKPDLIIAHLTAANIFLAKYAEEIMPGVPVVFTGDQPGMIPFKDIPSNFAGIVREGNPAPAVSLILQAQPETKKIYIVMGDSPQERETRLAFPKDLASFSDKVEIVYLNHLPFPQMMETIKGISGPAVILYISYFQDVAKNNFVPTKVAGIISQAANVPTYGISAPYMGTGVVGGYQFSAGIVGERAAELGTKVLLGSRISDFPREQTAATAEYRFDWRALKRWGIDERRLPPESKFEYRVPTLWEAYKWYLVGGFIFVLVETFLVFGLLINRVKRKKGEEALIESEKKYRELVRYAPAGIYELDYETNRFTSVNDVICEYTGYTRDELLTMNLFNLLTEESQPLMLAHLEKLLAGEKIETSVEYRIRTKNGNEFWSLINSRYIYEAEKLKGTTGIIYDITDRKQAEEQIYRANAFLDSIVENIPNMLFLKDAGELRFVRFNRAGEDLLGYSRNDLLGKSDYDFFLKEQADHFTKKDREVLRGKEVVDIPEEPLQTRNKGERTIHTKKVPILDATGEPQYLLGISEDITERKLAEKQLQDTLESLRKAVGVTIQVLASAVETRDPYTSGHQTRSADLARTIAMEMGLPQDKIEGIGMAGSIHDLGKISIPAEILSKPTKLSEIEFALIKEHANRGYEMLKDVVSQWPLAEIVRQHHERMDGSGYPRNLKGDDILIEARILSVADVVEAMASHRPYRPGLGIDAALAEIEKNRGIFYDNAVADACLRLFREKGFKLEGT